MNTLQLTQISYEAELLNRRPASLAPALYLPRLKICPLKRKLPVVMDAETLAQMEHPVKIRQAG